MHNSFTGEVETDDETVMCRHHGIEMYAFVVLSLCPSRAVL